MDRSVIVQMQRKAPGETVERVRANLFERNQQRRRRCLRWAEDNLSALKGTRVELPHYGNDRARDNWEPLLAIAQVVGGDWPRRATAAFAKLSAEEEEESVGPMLLADIREVLTEKHATKMWSYTLVEALTAMEDRPWCEWKRGKPMTQNTLGKLLDPYKIHSGSVRVGNATRKGYRISQFENAFNRYLIDPAHPHPKQSGTTAQPSNGAGYSEIQSGTDIEDVPL